MLESSKMSVRSAIVQLGSSSSIRHNWRLDEVNALFAQPFNDLIFQAQTVHRENFDANEIQISSLLSIKTGSCSEDCGYCPQSARFDANLKSEALMPIEEVVKAAASGLRSRVLRAFAWVPHGGVLKIGILRGLWKWSRRSSLWVWRLA